MWCLIVVTFFLKPPSFPLISYIFTVGGDSSLLSKTNCYAVECFYFGILILFKLKVSFFYNIFSFPSFFEPRSPVSFSGWTGKCVSVISLRVGCSWVWTFNCVHSICHWNGPGFAFLLLLLGSGERCVVNVPLTLIFLASSVFCCLLNLGILYLSSWIFPYSWHLSAGSRCNFQIIWVKFPSQLSSFKCKIVLDIAPKGLSLSCYCNRYHKLSGL